MAGDFPVPRSEIPLVDVSPEEYMDRKLQMDAMVHRMVQEFEEYSEVNKRHINLRRWKQVASKERCKLYKERPKYQTTSSARTAQRRRHQNHASVWRDDLSEDSYSGAPVSTRSSTSSGNSSARLRTRTASSTMTPPSTTVTATAEEAETLVPNLMIGERPGRLEDAMHALVARDHDELSLVVVFLHEDVGDCSTLATLESPTEDEPYKFLGYKWFVKPSPAHSKFVKNRDSLYVEYTGITQTQSGEVLGFHIMHSIDIDGFPDFHDRNCVRASQSISTLYYQKEENMVEIFLMGNVGIGGTIGGLSPMAGFFAADTMFGMPRSIDCGEAKRLTELVHLKRRTRAAQGMDLRKTSVLCRLCRSEKKSYNLVSLVTCEICAQTICSRCKVYKKVFESDGILGKFVKVNCCKTCVISIEQTHLPPAKPAAAAAAIQQSIQQIQQPQPQLHRHWSAPSMTLYEEESDGNVHAVDVGLASPEYALATPVPVPVEEQPKTSHEDHASGRGKMSLASTVASTVASDSSSAMGSLSVQDLFHHDENEMMFRGPQSISESSEFDRSFAIVSQSTANYHQRPTTANDRDTFMSTDDLHDDHQDNDWASKSYYGRSLAQTRGQPQPQPQPHHYPNYPSQDRYAEPPSTARMHRHRQEPQYESRTPRGSVYQQYPPDQRMQSHTPRGGHGNYHDQQRTVVTPRGGGHDPRMQALTPRGQQQQSHTPRGGDPRGSMQHYGSSRPHENRIQLAHQQRGLVPMRSATATSMAPSPRLARHHSADATRDQMLSRMQHLSQLAEETYNTTRDNEHLLTRMQTNNTNNNGPKALESRNRFFYY